VAFRFECHRRIAPDDEASGFGQTGSMSANEGPRSRRPRIPYMGLVGLLVVALALVFVVRAFGSGGTPSSSGPASTGAAPGASSGGTGTTGHPPTSTGSGHPATPTSRPGGTNVYAAIEDPKLSPAVANDPQYLYVPNGIPGTVEVIDPVTYRIVRTIHLGYRSFPEHVTPSWDLRWLYVDTSAASELAVIDPRTGKLARIIHDITHPYNLYFTPDGRYAIDVAEYVNELRFYDPHTWKLVKALPIPGNGPDHMDFSADGGYLLIGCEFDGNVFKVSLKTLSVVGRVNITGLPVDVKLSPDGTVFYVANQGTGGVYVIDPVTMKVVKFIRTGRGAHGMAISRDTTELYLTNRLAGTLSVINFAQRRVTHTYMLGGSPDMVQVSTDGSQIWISNRYGTTVEVVSATDGHIIKQIQVGTDPHGISLFPQPGRFSLGHNGVYR
jgi:YVTN family beta-propeller protein